jgi:hypothetical protein
MLLAPHAIPAGVPGSARAGLSFCVSSRSHLCLGHLCLPSLLPLDCFVRGAFPNSPVNRGPFRSPAIRRPIKASLKTGGAQNLVEK